MKNIAIFGEIFSLNLGDAVIFDCLQRLFSLKGIHASPVDLSGRLSWFDLSPEKFQTDNVSLFRRLARIPLRRSRQLRRAYSAVNWYLSNRSQMIGRWENIIASSDAVLLGGGQLLTDMNFDFVPRIYDVANIAAHHCKPFAIFGCGVGAGWSWLAKKMYKDVATKAKYISVRDFDSKYLLRHYGIDHIDIDVHPDPAFSLGQSAWPLSLKTGSQILGINFQPAVHFKTFRSELKNLQDEQYLDFWYRLARGACLAGNQVTLLTNGDPADFLEASKVATRLMSEGVSVRLEDRPSRPEQLLAHIGRVETLICTRMHAGIIAYTLGKRVVPVSWDRKVDGVWETVGLKSAVVPASVLLHSNPWGYFSERINNSPVANEDHISSLKVRVANAVDCCVEKIAD